MPDRPINLTESEIYDEPVTSTRPDNRRVQTPPGVGRFPKEDKRAVHKQVGLPDVRSGRGLPGGSLAVLPEIVVTAFHRAGRPLPELDRVDRVGYSAEEVRDIERELARRHREDDA